MHRIINKYASTVLSYDKTDSNVLKGFVFNLQMLENHDTFHSKPYNLSPELETCLDELMDEYLEKGYIVPIANPKITSSVFLVPKNANEKMNAAINNPSAVKPKMKYRMVVITGV